MALTTGSHFSRIELAFLPGEEPDRIFWTEDPGGETGQVNLNPYPAVGSTQLSDLLVLQSLYTIGFTTNGGSEIIPIVRAADQSRRIVVPENLEPNGLPNPFIAGFEDRWNVRDKFRGTIVRDGGFTEDTDLDQRTISIKANLDLPNKAAPGTTFSQSLAEIGVTRIGSHGYLWFIEFDTSDEVLRSDLDELPLWLAFRGWLESIRTNGQAVGFDADSDQTYNGRQYETTIRNDAGVDKTFLFNLLSSSVGAHSPLDENGNVDYWYVVMDRDNTAPALSADAMNAHMDGLSRNITVDSTMAVVKQKLVVDQIDAIRLKSGTSTLEFISGVPVISRGTQKRVLGTGHGVQLHLDELSKNADDEYLLSTKRDYEVLSVRDHADLSDSGAENILVLAKPTEMLRYGPQNRPINIEHPLKYDRAIDVRFWDDTSAFWHRPGENVTWRWIREEDGSGRLEATDPPDRLISFGALESGVGSSLGLNEVMKITGFETGRNAYLIPNPLAPTTNPNRVDSDGFTLETIVDSAEYTLAEWEALTTQFNMNGMWSVDRGGLLDIEIIFDLFATSSASGTFVNSQAELWTKKDSGSDPLRLAIFDSGVNLGGTRNTVPIALNLRRYAAVEGQLFWHVLTAAESQSMADDKIVLSGHHRTCVLSGEILKEE